MIWIAVLWLYPWHAIDVYTQPYELESTTVSGGEWIKYEVGYCRHTDVDSHVTHELVNKKGDRFSINAQVKSEAQLDTDGIRLREGCGTITKAVYIPHFIEPDTYYLKESVTYQVNPFHTTPPYIFVTEEFNVI